jgi:hypothetical protein
LKLWILYDNGSIIFNQVEEISMSKVLIITLLLTLLTGGAVYAVNHAAPGHAPYPADRAIESWQAGLTGISDKAAQLQAQFAAERLVEAEAPVQGEGGDNGNSRFCSDLSGSKHPAGRRLAAQYGVAYDTVMTWFCQSVPGGKAG